MKVIIAGGGTGGHVYPGLSVAAELKRRGGDVLWVGTGSGLESRLVPLSGFAFEKIPATSLSGRNLSGIIQGLGKICLGLIRAALLLRRFRPDLVMGAGGFVSFPTVAAAFFRGIPVLLMEQNVLPGRVNRRLSSRAAIVSVAYEESLRYLNKARVEVTGNPVRSEITACREMTSEKRREIAVEMGLDPERVTILAFGGSRGAASINRAILEAVVLLEDRQDLQVLHLAGREGYEKVSALMPPPGEMLYRLLPYLDEMSKAYAIADLVVCRAGATTLAELACCGRPAIMIPYPYAADNHQEHNAGLPKKTGAAEVILDADLNGSDLAATITGLVQDRKKLHSMGEKMRALFKEDAAVTIADLAEVIIGKDKY